MQDNFYDVIVVGAGFAGLACARELAAAGLRVCVIERKRDLGERLHTTGILVQEALDEPALHGVPAGLLRAVPRVRLYAPSLASIRLAAPGYRFFTTDTPGLMRWLGAQAVAGGVELRLGCGFRDAQRTAQGWQLPGIGRCRYLVGADGVRSRVAARLGLGRVHEVLHGMEYEYDGIALREPDALHCFVSRRFAPGYIGWVAQTPTGVQAGLALRRRGQTAHAPAPDLAGFLDRIAPLVGLDPQRPPDAVRAGAIPCGGAVTLRRNDAAVLVGDAAGMVSPVTAGGIHAGLRHGARTGRALAAALADGRPFAEPRGAPVRHMGCKRALRWAFDRFQSDWPVDLLLGAAPVRRIAEQVYFHRRGQAVAADDVASTD